MPAKPLIWILEDNPDHQFIYAQILNGIYETRFFSKGIELLDELPVQAGPLPGLLIADLHLPDCFFLDLLTTERGKALEGIPFLVVSSVDDSDALRTAFDEGAIDYLIKPFRESELRVKVERALARSRKSPGASRFEGVRKMLTLRELKIFDLLASRHPGTVELQEIVDHVWPEVHVQANAVNVHIHNLRRKTAPMGISIVHGGGKSWKLVCGSDDRMDPAPSADPGKSG